MHLGMNQDQVFFKIGNCSRNTGFFYSRNSQHILIHSDCFLWPHVAKQSLIFQLEANHLLATASEK